MKSNNMRWFLPIGGFTMVLGVSLDSIIITGIGWIMIMLGLYTWK